MKKILILFILFAVFVVTGCSIEPEDKDIDVLQNAKDRGYFVVGVSHDSKPFSFLDDKGAPAGLDVDIAKRIAKTVFGDENKIQFKKTEGFRSVSLLTSGELDFILAAMTITPQRQLIVDFSDPYYYTGQAILVRANSNIRSPKDLNKKKVVVELNTTAEKTPKKFAPAAILMGYKTGEDFNAFSNGEGDALVSDEALLMGFLEDHPVGYKLLPQRLSIEPYGVAIKSTDGAASLKAVINNVLSEMKTDKSFDKLKEKWHLT
jgi:putative glutamine transport system substrate-binding protein